MRQAVKFGSVRSFLLAILLVMVPIVGVMTFIPELASGRTLYVGPNSTHSTIQEAIDAANQGDTILIAKGTYRESLVIDVKDLSLIGNDTARTVIEGNVDSIGILITSDHVDIGSLTILNSSISARGDHLNITSIISSANGKFGADLVGCDFVHIANSTLPKRARFGLSLTDCSNVSIYNCVFYVGEGAIGLSSIGSRDIDVNFSNFYVHPIIRSTGIFSDKTIGLDIDNTFFSVPTNDPTDNISGMILNDTSHFNVQRCEFHLGQCGILVEGGSMKGRIEGNKFIDQMGPSSPSLGVNLSQCQLITLSNNTFLNLDISNTISGVSITLKGNNYTLGRKAGVVCTGKSTVSLMDEEFYFPAINSPIIGLIVTGESHTFLSNSLFKISGGDQLAIKVEGYGTSSTFDSITCDSNWWNDQCLYASDPIGTMYLYNSSFVSTSSKPALEISSVHDVSIRGCTIDSTNTGLMIREIQDALVERCTIHATPSISIGNSDLRINDSDIQGKSASSIAAKDSSFVETLDVLLSGITTDATSNVNVRNSITLRTIDRFGRPIEGVDLRVNTDGAIIYETEHFNPLSDDPATGPDGRIAPLPLLNAQYIGTSPVHLTRTNAQAYSKGNSDMIWSTVYTIDTSSKREVALTSPDIDVPMTPRNVTVIPLETREGLLVKWDQNDDDTLEYRIFSLDTVSETWTLEGSVPFTNSTWLSGDLGQSFRAYYTVKAWDGFWESAPSAIASGVTVDLTPPDPPSDIMALDTGQTSIQIGWSHPGASDLAGFEVFMNRSRSKTEFDLLATVQPMERAFTAGSLSMGTMYLFKLRSLDLSGNPSVFSKQVSATTQSAVLEVRVVTFYGSSGPLADQPSEGARIYLYSFNRTIISSGIAGSDGMVVLDDMEPDEPYYVVAYPPVPLQGEEGISDGYLEVRSDPFIVNESSPSRDVHLLLPYYIRNMFGVIKATVLFNGGPRSGPVYGADVLLHDEGASLISNTTTNGDGIATFRVDDLPFRGYLKVVPQADLRGDMSANISGYLSSITGMFELDALNNSMEDLRIELSYFRSPPPPEPLLIAERGPSGESVNLNAHVLVRFNQPVDTGTVEVKIEPAPFGSLSYVWDDTNTTLRIVHGGFKPSSTYMIRIGNGARSSTGTSFPEGYSRSTWSFRTTGSPEANGSRGISKGLLYGLVMIVLLIALGIALYLFVANRKKKEERGEGYEEFTPGGKYDFSPEEEAFEELGELAGEGYQEDLVDGIIEEMPFSSADETLDELEELEG